MKNITFDEFKKLDRNEQNYRYQYLNDEDKYKARISDYSNALPYNYAIKAGFVGFVVGDAMGVPTEFIDRKKLADNPVFEMIEDGSHGVPKGYWSDDSSMTIATMESMLEKNELDYDNIMENFVEWVTTAKYTPTDRVFDIGRTCLRAIRKYSTEKNSTTCGLSDLNSNGNGSLMRMLPIAYYCYYKKMTDEESFDIIKKSSALTHAHEISVMGCYMYYQYLKSILDSCSKEEAYTYIKNFDYSRFFTNETISTYDRILIENINEYELDKISSSGYVVHTFESVLWCFLNYDNYKDIIIKAINVGNDTDTIAAIVGSIAGIYYGYDNIPKEWVDDLQKEMYLLDLSNRFTNFVEFKEKSYE